MNYLSQRESELLIGCKHILRVLDSEDKLMWRRIHSQGLVFMDRFGRLVQRPNHDMSGISDLQIWINGGPMLCVELKSARGKLSDSQRLFKWDLARVNHPYELVRSTTELEELLTKYGVKHWSFNSKTQ